jgi:glycosyltransferase involved in cell wall biosynthesis
MIHQWEQGFPIVAAIKNSSDESGLMYRIRTTYYRLVARLANVEVLEHFTGFGLYDRSVIEQIRANFRDPYPYFRGMIAELGLPIARVFYNQARRERGITSNNFYSLYDLAMLGITNLSKVPLRLVIFAGFISALISFILGVFYLVYKLIFWNNFTVGVAPVVLGLFFLGSVQLIALGIIGEYVGSIHTLVLNRPLVTEKERINF